MSERRNAAQRSAASPARRPAAAAARRGTAARRPAVGAPARRAGGHAAPRRRGGSWLARQLAQRPRPVWVLIVADFLVFAVALNVFALFHHVLPRREAAVGITSQRGGAAAVQAAATEAPAAMPDGLATEAPAASAPADQGAAAAPAEAAQPQADPVGNFATKFADKFTGGEVERTESGYRSANINMTFTPYEVAGVHFYVMDFYLKDISSFQTGFAKDKFARGEYERVSETLARMNAVAGINGDYYGGRSDGIVLRNGTLYRSGERLKRDLCVLYWDGTLETYSPEGFDVEAEIARGAYQIWNFGPMLLDQNGQVMSKFNSDVNPRNPRTAIGYFEPGHYCFVVVDGRSDDSKGLTLQDLSKLVYNLGCVRAYNLDGGKTSVMIYGSDTVNKPAGGGRMSTDVVGIVEP